MLRLRQMYAIGKVTFLDNLRKQVLQVVLILTLAAVASTTLLSFFDMGIQIKILKDLSLAAILFCGGILAITVSVGCIPSELQNHTAYPTLARAVRRGDYLLGHYFGVCATCFLCTAIVGGVFVGILGVYEHSLDVPVIIGMGYVFLEVTVLAAIGMFFSVFLSPMVSATLTLFVFLLGQIKVTYLHGAIERATVPVSKQIMQGFYYLLPNLDCFTFKDALVHNIPIPSSFLVLVAVYAIVYIGFLVSASGAILSRKEI
ncbi:MAG: ABC transporter permease subunit [Armatimonadota bacterium]